MSEVKEDKVFPFIEGENVSLCPVNMDHINLYTKWMNSPILRKFTRNIIPKTIEEVKKNFESKDQPVKEEIYFEIWHIHDKKPIGIIGFHRIQWFTRSSHLYHLIDPDYWGQDNEIEAVKLVVEYGFKELNLHKITVRIDAPNKTFLNIVEKIGFEHEITLEKEIYLNGEHVDILEYSIFKEDWMKSQ